jgi:hypothetical protein
MLMGIEIRKGGALVEGEWFYLRLKMGYLYKVVQVKNEGK